MEATLSAATKLGVWAKAASYCGDVKLLATPIEFMQDIMSFALAAQVSVHKSHDQGLLIFYPRTSYQVSS